LIALAKLNPMHRESRVLIAEQTVVLHRWDEARNLLAPLAEDYSSARVCNLMADIAQGEQDVLTAQLWRSRAARGGRIADWRCTRCTGTASEWGAVCPHCGAFDTLRWTAPEMAAPEPVPRPGAPLQMPAPVRPGSQTGGPIIDSATRGRTRAGALQREDRAPRFVRPDDPGPGGHADIFGGTGGGEEHPPEPAETGPR